ncbi:MAG: SMC family ATPase, partial [Nanoarchaeota archaeon]
MKLKKIILNNIRSFEHQEIEFLEGATLLSGDIGCGKTSILLAIEFALFGLQPGQRGFVLLRNGAETGSVNLEFEIEDKNIIIERTLKKSKTISQDYCSIRINGEKQELSVTELKNKVLHLLNYHKEFAKKQNVLYKFTVYTPQEEMKEIILQNPQIRINTLRHVFGVSKYKQLLENILIIISKLREEKRMKQGLTANFEEDKEKLLTKEEELEEKYYNLASIEKQLFLKKQQRKKIQEEKEEVSKKVEERKQLKQEIEKTKIIISNKQETFSSNLNLINNLKVQIKELQELNFDAFKISELENKILENKRKKENLNDKNVQINAQINSLVMQNEEHRKLESKISNLDICPTCLQNVDAVYRANVLNNLRNDISK